MSHASMLVAVVAAALLIAPAAPAQAPACGHRSDIVKHLGAQYRERPVALGLSASGILVELLTSAEGATWTLLLTWPDGTSCLAAAGDDWQTVPAALEHGNES